MADDKKIIFSMVGVSKMFPPHKQVIDVAVFFLTKLLRIGLLGADVII